ncbi:MAG: sigma 54-interacting transcriptional regulator [Deltaproteobacteria bacterium]|nr:sigma 54-interacting transcriptional regulator [Deltaproteobacteria bacterium]
MLYHPDFTRIGQVAVLAELLCGDEVRLSRSEPPFALPGTGQAVPLQTQMLPDDPILMIRPAGDGVELEFYQPATLCTLDGQQLGQLTQLTADALDYGAVLELGDAVLLLLTRVEVGRPLPPPQGMVGHSDGIQRLRREILSVARVDAPVLIRGETGSGKERVARAIHDASPRANRPFVAVNMAAVVASAAASELFGHRRGAFTDAVASHVGHFGLADGGTLFLDEIGEAPPSVQTLLLRALDEGNIQPVGGTTRKVDVRLITATDADLEYDVENGRFRDALLHRIQVCTIDVPPLSQHREDIPALLVHFLREQLKALGAERLMQPPPPQRLPWLTLPVVRELVAYSWPGNVRQLRNVATEIAVRDHGHRHASLPPSLQRTPTARRNSGAYESVHVGPPSAARRPSGAFESVNFGPPNAARRMSGAFETVALSPASFGGAPPASFAPASPQASRSRTPPSQLSDDTITQALRDANWNITVAAQQLGIAKNSLVTRMAAIGGLRRANQLTPREIEAARAQVGDDPRAMAQLLQVSERGLLLHLRQLQSVRCGERRGDHCSELCVGLDEPDDPCRDSVFRGGGESSGA